jgi:hypothetical protein
MFSYIESNDEAKITIRIDFENIKEGDIKGFLDEYRKIEGFKKAFRNKVAIEIYSYEDIPAQWHTLLKVRYWMFRIMRAKPQLIYYLTPSSLEFVLKCLIVPDYTSLKAEIQSSPHIQDYFDLAIAYCKNSDEIKELIDKIYDVSGYNVRVKEW